MLATSNLSSTDDSKTSSVIPKPKWIREEASTPANLYEDEIMQQNLTLANSQSATQAATSSIPKRRKRKTPVKRRIAKKKKSKKNVKRRVTKKTKKRFSGRRRR